MSFSLVCTMSKKEDPFDFASLDVYVLVNMGKQEEFIPEKKVEKKKWYQWRTTSSGNFCLTVHSRSGPAKCPLQVQVPSSYLLVTFHTISYDIQQTKRKF